MTMVGRSYCQILVPGQHHHDDEDARDRDEGDIDKHEDVVEEDENDVEEICTRHYWCPQQTREQNQIWTL